MNIANDLAGRPLGGRGCERNRLSPGDDLVECGVLELDIDVMIRGIARLERDRHAGHQAQDVGLEHAPLLVKLKFLAQAAAFLASSLTAVGLGR